MVHCWSWRHEVNILQWISFWVVCLVMLFFQQTTVLNVLQNSFSTNYVFTTKTKSWLIPFYPRHWINIYFLRNSEKQTAARDLFPIEVIRILQPMQKLHRVKTALYVRCCHLDRLLFLGDQLVLCIWENSIYLIKSPRPTEQWTGLVWTAFWRDIFKTIDIFWRLNLNEKSLVITLYWILICVYRARAGYLLESFFLPILTV